MASWKRTFLVALAGGANKGHLTVNDWRASHAFEWGNEMTTNPFRPRVGDVGDGMVAADADRWQPIGRNRERNDIVSGAG